ncbi:hypothetical protein EON80_03975 [bacterium]|nr:MAG: hypothetical protein EON80_03975 [bacterium]
MSNWWRLYQTGSRTTGRWEPDPDKSPIFHVGDVVRLRGKPNKPRRVLSVRWHAFRYDYSYLIETSYSARFGALRDDLPYWFAPQLVLESEWNGG